MSHGGAESDLLSAEGIAALASGVLAGRKASVARALNLVEDRREGSRRAVGALLRALREGSGGHRVGLTGPPGVGKSTLAAALARTLRERGRTVGVVAVDPSSVRSGGSLLGDRARMGFDPRDEGVFVRSLATGGEAGGLSWAAPAAAHVLAAAYEIVLLETTGVGQTETDIRHVADTVVLVVQPGSGDVLQFLKAGIMEIPDLLVVNKADTGALAERATSDLRSALASTQAAGLGEAMPILATSATESRGLDALADALEEHQRATAEGRAGRRRRGEVAWTLQLFRRLHGRHGVATLGGEAALTETVDGALDADAPPTICAHLSEAYLAAVSQLQSPTATATKETQR